VLAYITATERAVWGHTYCSFDSQPTILPTLCY